MLEIHEPEAAIVQRIYAEFVAGRSAREIAKRLNAEGVPSPRGGLWNQSTVRGDPKKHVGILNNPLYVGELIWGRREWRKDPDSDRRERRYRLRPEADWTRVAVPDLRIVDDALAKAARGELNRRELPVGATSAVSQRRSHYLLSGLIKCATCGSSYVVAGKDYYRCASMKERGSCGNKASVRISVVEDLVLSTLQSELLTDDHARLFATEFNRELERLRRDEASRDVHLRERLAALDAEIANLAANMLSGVVSATLARMLEEREAEADRLRATLARPEGPATNVLPHPTLRSRFERRVASLRESLSDPDARSEAATILSELIETITIHPGQDAYGADAEAEIAADLVKVAAFAYQEGRPPRGDRPSTSSIKVVAGTGFEPVTFRL